MSADDEGLAEPAEALEAATEVDAPEADVPLDRVLEALLFVADEPIDAATLAAAAESSADVVTAALEGLQRRWDEEERGFVLRHTGAGWRLYTADECAPAVERFLIEGRTARLSQAALETLAVVAYQQPVSRARIAAIRGVASDSALRSLTTRGLVREGGLDSATGAALFTTTEFFLERLGLQNISDLPSLAPLLPELEDIENG